MFVTKNIVNQFSNLILTFFFLFFFLLFSSSFIFKKIQNLFKNNLLVDVVDAWFLRKSNNHRVMWTAEQDNNSPYWSTQSAQGRSILNLGLMSFIVNRRRRKQLLYCSCVVDPAVHMIQHFYPQQQRQDAGCHRL